MFGALGLGFSRVFDEVGEISGHLPAADRHLDCCMPASWESIFVATGFLGFRLRATGFPIRSPSQGADVTCQIQDTQ